MEDITTIIRSIYGYREKSPGLSCGKSRTQQHFKDECDINNIIARHNDTGSWTGDMKIPTRQPQFGDFTAIPDLQTAQNMILDGRDAFEALPARVRKIFDNSPINYLNFMSDVNNLDQAFELGLISESDADLVRSQIEAAQPKPRKLKVIPEDSAVDPADE